MPRSAAPGPAEEGPWGRGASATVRVSGSVVKAPPPARTPMGPMVKVPALVAWKRYWIVRVMLVRPPDIWIELEEPLPR